MSAAMPLASDFNLRCRQFQCRMAGSYCTTKCTSVGRASVPCGDLAKYASENPDQMRALVASVAAAGPGTVLSAKFQESFPAYLPGAVVPEAQVTPAAALPPANDSLATFTAAVAIEAPPALPALPAPYTPATPFVMTPQPPKPPLTATAVVRRKPKTKDQPMPPEASTPDPKTNAGAPVVPGLPVDPPKRRGGIQKGQKLGPRRKNVEFVRDGTATFIETEKGSGLFRGVPGLASAEDALLIQNGARVIWALRIRPF